MAHHVEHGGGFRPEVTGDAALSSTLARRAIPQISNESLVDLIHEMYVTRRPLAVNDASWGLAQEDLPETDPVHGRTALAAGELPA